VCISSPANSNSMANVSRKRCGRAGTPAILETAVTVRRAEPVAVLIFDLPDQRKYGDSTGMAFSASRQSSCNRTYKSTPDFIVRINRRPSGLSRWRLTCTQSLTRMPLYSIKSNSALARNLARGIPVRFELSILLQASSSSEISCRSYGNVVHSSLGGPFKSLATLDSIQLCCMQEANRNLTYSISLRFVLDLILRESRNACKSSSESATYP
jgi:hypothetical protein